MLAEFGGTSPSRSLGSLISAPSRTVMKPECVFLPWSLFRDSCEKQCFCHANYSSSCLDSAPGLLHSHPYRQPQARHPAHRGLLESKVVFKAGPILLALSWWPLKGTRKAQRREDGPQEEEAGCVDPEDEGLGPGGMPWHPCLACCPIRCVGTTCGAQVSSCSSLFLPSQSDRPALFPFFNFELKEACVWESAVLIRETHSVKCHPKTV